ncbi:MAG: extracellular solute-binding protein [Eubacteriales bacterium]
MKNRIFKKVVATLLVSVLALSMVACGSSDDTTTDTADTSTDDTADTTEVSDETPTDTEELKAILDGTTISFYTCQGKYFEEYALMADYILETYGCTVEFQISPDDEYFTLLSVKLSTGEVPDVFEYNLPLQNGELDVVNTCEDLSDEPWVERLVNPDIAYDPDDGNIYALPASSMGSVIACFYNTEVLEACGVTDFQPSTYDEWLAILDLVKENGDGVTPLYMTNASSWTTQVFMTAGVPIAMDDPATSYAAALTGEVAITDLTEYVDVMTSFTELIDGGYVNDDHLSVDYDTAAAAIGTGEAAMYFINTGFATDVASKYPDLELGAMVIPFDDSETLSITQLVQGLFVPSEGDQIDVTKAFLQAWSTAECQQIYFDSIAGYPAYDDVDGGTVLECLSFLSETYVATGNTEFQANDYLADTSDLQSELFTFYVSVAAGISTPEEALEDFEKIFVDYQQQAGVEGF